MPAVERAAVRLEVLLDAALSAKQTADAPAQPSATAKNGH